MTHTEYLEVNPTLRDVSVDAPGISRSLLPDGRQEWIVKSYDIGSRLLRGPLRRYTIIESSATVAFHDAQGWPGPTSVRALLDLNENTIAQAAADVASELLAELRHQEGPVDLVTGFGMAHAARVFSRLMDLPLHQVDQLQEWGVIALEQDSGRALSGLRNLMSFISPLAAERAEGGGEDLISQYLHLNPDLTPAQRAHAVSQMLLDGSWFVSDHVVVSAVHRLLDNPAAWDRLVAEPSGVPGAVNEAIRLFDPTNPQFEAGGWCYRLSEPIGLADATMNVGDELWVDVVAISTDPTAIKDPHRFDPWRDDPLDVPWAEENAMCQAMRMMRTNTEAGVAAVIAEAPRMRLAVPGSDLQHRAHPLGGFVSYPVHLQ